MTTGYQIGLAVHVLAAMTLVVGLALRARPLLGAGGGLALLSGLFLASQGWGFQPWTALGLVGLVALGAGGARLPPVPAAQGALLGLAAGVVWLMATKPGWTGALLALVISSLLGLAAGRYWGVRRERAVV